MILKFMVFLIALCFFALPAEAKNLYVCGMTGNDSVTYNNNSSSAPWRTIGRAVWGSTNRNSPNSAQAAQPGDTVLISAGIYWTDGESPGGRWTVALNPVNNGTQNNPIIFRGVGNVYIRMNYGFRGPMIGCNNRNYIIWDNFQIEDYYGGSASDTGPVVFTGNANHCQIINSDIKGHSGSYYHRYPIFTGNYCGIRLEPAHNTIVRNNRIYNFTGGQNEAGIMFYDSNRNIIENNEIFNNGSGIFIKGIHPDQTQANNIIRKNLIYQVGAGGGIRVLGASDTLVYQNIVHSGASDGAKGLWAGFFNSTRSRFVNNTIYGVHRGIVPQGGDLDDVQFLNNIIVNSTVSAIYNWDQENPSTHDVNYNRNCYYNTNHIWQNEGRTRLNLSQFQSYEKDLNGIEADPLFIDTSENNFRLEIGSPARTLGRTIMVIHGSDGQTIPAGAYITGNEIIGREGQSTPPGDSTTISPPVNLSIVN